MPTKDSFLRKLPCTTDYEEMAWKYGAKAVAGIDECARGNWAGPTVAAACILPRDLPESLAGKLRDSKLLSPKKRAALAGEIKLHAVAWCVAEIPADIIDEINIREAAIMAMEESVHGLAIVPDFLLVDAVTVDLPVEQLAIEHGDALSVSIAAASILAKTYHTELMVSIDTQYPGYGFARHQGYGTKEHVQAIERLGLTPLHRRSFAPVRKYLLATGAPQDSSAETTVVHCKREEFDIYIGRPSKWGNPFSIGKDGDRGEVLTKYGAWIVTQKRLVNSLYELRGKVLGCWCAPSKACHGHILAHLANGHDIESALELTLGALVHVVEPAQASLF